MRERSAESLLDIDSPAVVTEAAVVDVSIIIVNYNVREFLHQALQSVRRASAGLNVEVIVVDNNSADGSTEMVADEFPEVTLIENRDNTGFSRANNQGIRIAQGRYLLILNPDTILQEDTLTTLVDYLDRNPEAGAVGCQILNPDGSFAPESRRAFPTPRVALYRITGLSRLFPRSPRFGRYNMTFLPIDKESEVDALSGSCMMVRHAALYHSPERAESLALLNGRASGENIRSTDSGSGAGLFDETFFMYGEDLDWCFRIQQAGWSIRYTPETKIIHYKGESTKKGELRYVRLFYGAMATFAEKHLQSRYSRLFTLAIHSAIFARASLSAVAQVGRKVLRPMLEFGIVFTVVAALGTLILGRNGQFPPPMFFLAVAGGFALTYVVSALAVDAYAPANRRRIVPVWRSLAVALVVMATMSFFIKDIAFSRLLLPLSVGASGALLAFFRLSARPPAERTNERVLLVGSQSEHERLTRMLANQPSGLIVAGYVEVDESRVRRARASLSAVAQVGRKVLRPMLEFGIVFTVVAALGTLILGRNGQFPPPMFFLAVAGGFALTYVVSALAVDAYAPANRRRIVPVWRSLAVALVVMATMSFFIKDIAFSRLLLPLSVGASGALLAFFRLSARPPAERTNERVLLVGSQSEHERLTRMLANQPSGLIVAGYVEVDESRVRRARANKPLGPLRQLRDIIRLHHIDEVFFASSCISNQEIFRQMQLLRDLPAQFHILSDGPDIIIGKASIHDFSTAPIVDAASAVQSPRSTIARRAFELPIALAWLAAYPVCVLIDVVKPRRRPLRKLSTSMASVLSGRRALVGYDETGSFIPPAEWRLKPGVFFVTDAGKARQDLERVYWFYMQHQSSAMDWDIMRKSLSRT